MKIEKTKLDGVLLISPSTSFSDFRGGYVEIYNQKVYEEAGITTQFVQDDVSISYQNVLRGIHGDNDTTKLCWCSYGRIYQIVVNCDPSSSQYLQWQSFLLSDETRQQVLIPPKFGNSFLVLSQVAAFSYKQSTYYQGAGKQFTLRWNDPKIHIYWPIVNPILSERDATAAFLPE